MSIKINDKILSIPPYVSTNWSQIAALHMKGSVLAVTLVDGDTLHVPNLTSETVHLIFHYHAIYLEKEHVIKEVDSPNLSLKEIIEQGEPSIRLAFGSSLEGLGSIMQHNPSQANAPNLPSEILKKVGAIAKIIASDDLVLPKAEANCNCFYCQIAHVLNPISLVSSEEEDVEIKVEELQFQQWTIMQTGDNLFCVVNRLDEYEKYNVYLGEPVGCTCGRQGCEHILAVLKS